jgi:hypothetical protein
VHKQADYGPVCLPDTEEVTGSIPVPPTKTQVSVLTSGHVDVHWSVCPDSGSGGVRFWEPILVAGSRWPRPGPRNPAAAQLIGSGIFTGAAASEIEQDINRLLDFERPETSDEPYDRLTDRIVEWSRAHPDPVPREPNPALRI